MQRALFEAWQTKTKREIRREDLRAGHVAAWLINMILGSFISKEDKEKFKQIQASDLFPDPDAPEELEENSGGENLRALVRWQIQTQNKAKADAARERMTKHGSA